MNMKYRRWLMELTSLPTASGREDRVVAWIERWVAARDDCTLTRDRARAYEAPHLRLAKSHLDAMQVVLTKEIKGEGGKVGAGLPHRAPGSSRVCRQRSAQPARGDRRVPRRGR